LPFLDFLELEHGKKLIFEFLAILDTGFEEMAFEKLDFGETVIEKLVFGKMDIQKKQSREIGTYKGKWTFRRKQGLKSQYNCSF